VHVAEHWTPVILKTTTEWPTIEGIKKEGVKGNRIWNANPEARCGAQSQFRGATQMSEFEIHRRADGRAGSVR